MLKKILLALSLALALSIPAQAQIINGVTPQSFVVASQYTNATTTFSTITGLSWSIAANATVTARCALIWQNATQTVDVKYQVTGPASPTTVAISTLHNTSNAATGVVANNDTLAFSTPYDPNATLAASGVNFTDWVVITVVNGANAGTVALQAALHAASGTLQVQAGSSCQVQ